MRVSRTALGDDDRISTRIVTAVADAEGIPPTEVTPPLYRVVDPDALNQLFETKWAASEDGPHVSFTYCGYEVTVEGAGDIVVRTADDSDRERVV
ncbi:HalOD1 output domain-containing protein [Halorussus aquaticus]|uniref:HalOD1 output domain-containing protein n=1 Tax=Halorussus aquaticus TaxID=2953748 RepID=A0ABD5PWT0_9EURY|nr:HalOD1 output domain-containing protein [Halorussus aquaticus]